jgi:metal-responsive CopG/Arc/MetJ family transcriptional regulator
MMLDESCLAKIDKVKNNRSAFISEAARKLLEA